MIFNQFDWDSTDGPVGQLILSELECNLGFLDSAWVEITPDWVYETIFPST
jgi:hypothetical protein